MQNSTYKLILYLNFSVEVAGDLAGEQEQSNYYNTLKEAWEALTYYKEMHSMMADPDQPHVVQGCEIFHLEDGEWLQQLGVGF